MKVFTADLLWTCTIHKEYNCHRSGLIVYDRWVMPCDEDGNLILLGENLEALHGSNDQANASRGCGMMKLPTFQKTCNITPTLCSCIADLCCAQVWYGLSHVWHTLCHHA